MYVCMYAFSRNPKSRFRQVQLTREVPTATCVPCVPKSRPRHPEQDSVVTDDDNSDRTSQQVRSKIYIITTKTRRKKMRKRQDGGNKFSPNARCGPRARAPARSLAVTVRHRGTDLPLSKIYARAGGRQYRQNEKTRAADSPVEKKSARGRQSRQKEKAPAPRLRTRDYCGRMDMRGTDRRRRD